MLNLLLVFWISFSTIAGHGNNEFIKYRLIDNMSCSESRLIGFHWNRFECH